MTYQSRRMATLASVQPLPRLRASRESSSSFSLTCSCSDARMSRGSSFTDWAVVKLAPRRRAAPRWKRIVMAKGVTGGNALLATADENLEVGVEDDRRCCSCLGT